MMEKLMLFIMVLQIPPLKNSGDLSHQVISFNGNDPIALYKNDVLIDVVGIMDTPVP